MILVSLTWYVIIGCTNKNRGTVSSLPVEASIVSVEPLYVEMFLCFQDIWIYTFNPLQNTPPHVCHTVTTHCEVTARYFCHYLSFDIIPMLAVAILEAKSRAAHIFALGEAWTVRSDTLPVIDDITVLTCHKISDSVAVAWCQANYFRGGRESVGADGTLSFIANTTRSPTRCRSCCPGRPGR